VRMVSCGAPVPQVNSGVLRTIGESGRAIDTEENMTVILRLVALWMVFIATKTTAIALDAIVGWSLSGHRGISVLVILGMGTFSVVSFLGGLDLWRYRRRGRILGIICSGIWSIGLLLVSANPDGLAPLPLLIVGLGAVGILLTNEACRRCSSGIHA
jgi:hypothetical protein